MFETLDTMIALAVVYMILSMINKFILSGVKRLFKTQFNAMANELKRFASDDLMDYVKNNEAAADFVGDYTNKLKNIEKGFLRRVSNNNIKSMLEFKGSVEAFLKREKVEEIAGYLDIDLIQTKNETIEQAKAKALKVRDRVETVYNSTMEQASREYTKNMRYWAIFTGLLIAITMNADLFIIYEDITSNSTIRTELVAKAEGISQRVEILNAKIEAAEKTDTDKETLKLIATSTKEGAEELAGTLDNAGLKLGWEHEPWVGWEEAKDDPKNKGQKIEAHWVDGGEWKWAFNKIIGLIASALLIGFGAPFWHDLLTSLVGIKKVLRGKGKDTESATPKTPIK
jgi:hypothetical protein